MTADQVTMSTPNVILQHMLPWVPEILVGLNYTLSWLMAREFEKKGWRPRIILSDGHSK